MKQIRPDEVIRVVDSILNDEEVEESRNFFSSEDFTWMNELMSALGKRVEPHLLNDALVETREVLLASEKDAKHFFSLVSNCRRCDNVTSEPVVYEGKRGTAKVAFVLPYYSESISTKLKELLKEHFLEDTISFHYLIKCNTSGKSEDKNFNNCSNYIFSELQFFNSRIIILLGKQVAKFFFPNIDSIENWRGTVHYLSNYSFIVSTHPEDRSLDNEVGLQKWQSDLDLVKTLL